jgi:arsenate reductase (thioredoxin)
VTQCVRDTLARWDDAKVASFIPMLTERFTRERLRAVAQAEGTLVKEVPEILFVCVHNAGRSQMAAGLLDKHAEGRVHVRSAGSTPANQINPSVVEAMKEVGVASPSSSPNRLLTRLFGQPMS